MKKIFRLFISSTFSDFQVEREILQTKIFPKIREYCFSKGYTFQPIDLRWGVSNEAQLDQKALEMCIKEVQSCKRHVYPNFLIMLGDRYGWVPLPNIIKTTEFELIVDSVKAKEKELLINWYHEDSNEIPASYILKQRTNEYIDYDKWLEIESKLRDALQTAAQELDDRVKSKYFTSATELEAIEGIISYCTKTKYQQKLLELIPELEQLDHKHIFGFFREINKDTTIEDKFISDDYGKAQKFKKEVKRQLTSENILHVNTSQVSKDKLDEKYLDEFTESILKFLKLRIDQQIKKDEEKDYTSLELEKQQQRNYLNQKLENFLGQEKALDEIQNYINNEDTKPLIICGQSGIGKSSIMAKAIEDTSNTSSKKIVYRFIGATPNSTTTKDLLASILEEINITIKDKNESIENQFLTDEQSAFIHFSDKFHNAIIDIRDDFVIFIDAVDQLSNADQFLWLPNNLPSNVKIVISALKDRNYKDDSKYFYTLEDKISKFIEIGPFNEPIELLDLLLIQQNRVIQDRQKEYFLKQYIQVNTPLYLYMAANQILHWRSNHKVGIDITLSLSQKDIVKDFINNLTSLHHHDRVLVEKVFGYILASKSGLSEYEILELLNTNKEFIKTIAPDTWHINSTQELPLAIWVRLYRHIKPFLSGENQDGEELLYFFHREFINVVQNQLNQKTEHESIIRDTQKIIEKHQEREFDSNRWGKLYILLLINYYATYKDERKVFQYYKDILSFLGNDKVLIYLKYICIKRDESINDEDSFIAKHLTELSIHISNIYKKVSDEFYIIYITNLHYKANMLIQTKDYNIILEIEENNIKKIEQLEIFEKIKDFSNLQNVDFAKKDLEIELKWLNLYIQIKIIIGFSYLQKHDNSLALEINKNNYFLLKSLHENNPNDKLLQLLYYDQICYYTMALQKNGVFHQALELLKNSLEALENKYYQEYIYLYDSYAKLLSTLSGLCYSVKEFKDSQEYFLKAYKVYEKLLNYNFAKYSKTLTSFHNSLIENHNANNLFLESEHYYKYNIKLLNKNGNKGVEETINKISDDLFIKILDLKNKNKKEELFFVNKRLIEYVFNFDKEYWALKYVEKLIALGSLLTQSKIDDERLSIAEKLQEEGVNVCEQYMTEDDQWYDYYTKNMNNLANTYTYLNKKEEAYDLNKKNLAISVRLFQKDPQKWFRAYYWALGNMASTYSYNGDDKKEKECKEKIKELKSNTLFKFEKDVIKSKSDDKNIKYFEYFDKALLLLGIYFFIKYVFLE